MAIIQRPRRITSERASDEQKGAVDLVGSSINTFMEEVYIAVMGTLSITDNLNMELKTITVTVDSSGVPTTSVAYNSTLNSKTIGMTVVRAFSAIPTNQPFITFTDTSGLVSIQHISGLVADTEYQLVILALGL